MSEPQDTNRLSRAYNRMLENLRDAFHDLEESSEQALKLRVDFAKQKLYEMEEWTREEVDQVGDYLQRDLQNAATYLSETGQGFRDWMKRDLQLAESAFADMFANAVDTTRLELERFRQQAEQGEWYTGDITGPGILTCVKCGHRMRIETTTHVVPCPKCLGTVFRKTYGEKQ